MPAHFAIPQSSPMVRLNLARDMIRNANRILDLMENPGAAGTGGASQQGGDPRASVPQPEDPGPGELDFI